MRFLGLGLEGRVPDAKTVWLYREQLTQAGVIEALFETFDGYLKDQGYLAMGGQIIDASIVAVPKQRNSREENARIKAGETPAGWEDKPAKRRQKDVGPHGKSHYGYKNHVNVDRRHKLVRRYSRETLLSRRRNRPRRASANGLLAVIGFTAQSSTVSLSYQTLMQTWLSMARSNSSYISTSRKAENVSLHLPDRLTNHQSARRSPRQWKAVNKAFKDRQNRCGYWSLFSWRISAHPA